MGGRKIGPRRIVGPSSVVPRSEPDILVVTTKVKGYIKDRADMNTSDKIMEILSEKIKRLCDDAIDQARSEGRKTVLDRDLDKKTEF